MLEVEHAEPDLLRLETDARFTAGFDIGVVKRFRYTMQLIRTVSKKTQLYQFNGLRLKKLEAREKQHSMRLNKKWRLIVEFFGEEPDEKVLIVGIENHYED
jgi:proteic killer suppression protein